jgi:cytochrome b561
MDLWLLGVYKLPAVQEKADRAVFQLWEHTHAYLSWALAVLVVVHVLAAFRHQLVKRNDVMQRMWRGRVVD